MNKFNQSDELQQFYNELQEWIDQGCISRHPKFGINRGICGNLARYEDCYSDWWNLNHELHRQFKASGLNAMYPFGKDDFAYRMDSLRSMYECHKRLKWIKEHSNI